MNRNQLLLRLLALITLAAALLSAVAVSSGQCALRKGKVPDEPSATTPTKAAGPAQANP